MIDSTLIADLVRSGIDAELIGRVVAEITGQLSRSNVPDMSRTSVREYERARKQNQRKISGKQTMSAADTASQMSRTVPDNPCDVRDSLSNQEELDQGSKTVVVERGKRGTRLSPDWQLPENDRQFALDLGAANQQIDTMAAEFRDYWIAIPGARGTKLDWSATWRNRVRDIIGRRAKTHGRAGRGSVGDIGADLIARAKMREGEGDLGGLKTIEGKRSS